MKTLLIRSSDSVVMENDSLFIRSNELPYQVVNNWNTIKEYLIELIGKHPEEKFGCESLLGLKWFWLRKD